MLGVGVPQATPYPWPVVPLIWPCHLSFSGSSWSFRPPYCYLHIGGEGDRSWGADKGALGKLHPVHFFGWRFDTFSILYQAVTMQQNPRAQSGPPSSTPGLSDSLVASISQALD